MKTYYDGEEREIISITHWQYHPQLGDVWDVQYRRDGKTGHLPVPAQDELDAMRKFHAELAKHSVNYEDDNNVS